MHCVDKTDLSCICEHTGPNDKGLSRKHIIEGTKASLKRLDQEYVHHICSAPSSVPLHGVHILSHETVVHVAQVCRPPVLPPTRPNHAH